MQFLKGERGFISVIEESALQVTLASGLTSKASGAIYYLLTPDEPRNLLHWLAVDDYVVLLEGGPVEYFLFAYKGDDVEIRRGVLDTNRRMFRQPAGAFKALHLGEGAEFAWMATILTPDWSPESCLIGEGQTFLDTFVNTAPWATEPKLRELIGEDNFGVARPPDSKDLAVRADLEDLPVDVSAWVRILLSSQKCFTDHGDYFMFDAQVFMAGMADDFKAGPARGGLLYLSVYVDNYTLLYYIIDAGGELARMNGEKGVGAVYVAETWDS